MENDNNRDQQEEKEKLAEEERNFVLNQMSDEERRREVIEGKTGQLLGQVSIVVSVVALFIPLISDQVNSLSPCVKILTVLLFLAVVVTFIISIWIASHSWIIHKYGYERPDLQDVFKPNKPHNRLGFLENHRDVLASAVKQHIDINNTKGTQLIRAGEAFRVGIILLGVLVVGLSIALSLEKNEPKKIEISSPLKITFQDSAGKALQRCTCMPTNCDIHHLEGTVKPPVKSSKTTSKSH